MRFIFYILMMSGWFFQAEAYSLERFEDAQSAEGCWNEMSIPSRVAVSWKQAGRLVGMLKDEDTGLEAVSGIFSSALNLKPIHRRSIYEAYFQRERIDAGWVRFIFNDVQNFSEWHRGAVYAGYAGRQAVDPVWVRAIRSDIEGFEDEACKDYVSAALRR